MPRRAFFVILALTLALPKLADTAERTVVAAVAAGEFGKGAGIAEQRLGMTASAGYGGARLSPYMPAEMGRMGGASHRAGSHLAIALQDAELQAPEQAYVTITKALAAVTEGCDACHAAFGFR